MPRILCIIILVALIVIVSTTARSDEGPVGPSEYGWVDLGRKPVPDTESRQSKGAFCAKLAIVCDPNYFQNWDTPSKIFASSYIESIHRGQWFMVVVHFANPAMDSKGNSRLFVDLVIKRPDGSYSSLKSQLAWEGPPPPKNILGLSRKYLKAQIGSKGTLGLYQVEAKLYDDISGSVLALRSQLLVLAEEERTE